MVQKQVKRKPHPRDVANWFSKITFFYAFDLFVKGFKSDLNKEDLYDPLKSCNSKRLSDRLEKSWEIECKKHKKPSLYRVLWRNFGTIYILLGVIQLVFSTVMVLLVPQALAKFIGYFTPGQTALTKEDAYVYASIVILYKSIYFIYHNNYMLALTELGIRIRTAVCSLIYRKCLKLTEDALTQITMGKIVTIITKDVLAFERAVTFFNDIWIGLIQTGLVTYLIYNKIGVPAFVGIGFFLIIIPLQGIIGRISASYRLKTNKKTDERVQVTQETLSIIKIIKMYTWEKFFTNQITTSRMKEVKSIQNLFYLKVTVLIFGALSSKIAFYLLIMTYIWLGNDITAEIVYFIVGCFGKIAHILIFLIPMGIVFLADLFATNIRLNTIFESEEIPAPRTNVKVLSTTPKIILKNVCLTIKNTTFFKDISFEIEKGLNIVVGQVGCGKTTFLKTILREYHYTGELDVIGNVSYASQEPWLFPSSIKDNIIFGAEFSEKRYSKVLEVCALNHDLSTMSDGDNTIISNNGINLSKGQQARVNLARAIYRQADIYLLDDCLTALDGKVANTIFNNCIRTFLKDKICILVTSNKNHIKMADRIVTIEKSTVTIEKNQDKLVTHEEEKEEDIKFDILLKDYEQQRNVYEETKQSGKVEMKVYKKYLRFGGGLVSLFLITLTFIIAQGAQSYTDVIVGKWVTLEQNLTTLKSNNQTNTTQYEDTYIQRTNILNFYTVIIVVMTTLTILKSIAFLTVIKRICINMHQLMITKIINAVMKFFDNNFIGNILNRFSKDLCTIDEYLPITVNHCIELTFTFIGIIAVISVVNIFFLIPSIIFMAAAYLIRFVYQRTGRNLQRLDALTRSPLIGHLNASLEGLTTIRAFKAQDLVKCEFDVHQDLFTSANYNLHLSIRTLAFILDGMCSVFVSMVIAKFIVLPSDTTVGNVGLAISQAFGLTGLLQYGIRMWSEFENQMTSVERVLEYTEVDQEQRDGTVLPSWPKEGRIIFEQVCLSYNDNDKPVLNNINLTINPGKKVGIVGRTGAGKSSIISSLFRLYPIKGRILIDDVDIKTVSLNFLRSNITTIPQDPVIFSGTFRENLDPLKKYEDNQLWNAIKTVKLDKLIVKLEEKIPNNLSAGQKQLISLARAILVNSKIVILDEATASLDDDTDIFIRDVITKNFSEATMIIIAHRLSSILNCDMIIVVENGEIIEIGEPKELANNQSSRFHEMMERM